MNKILIIEDNEKNLKLFSVIIKFLGYATLTAMNGKEGVSIAKENAPDLILMDIQMPVMDGITALNMLKSDEKTKNIPVIALTSYAMAGDKEKFLGLGFSDYISKPIDKDGFIKAIENILKEK
ncbi:MAG: two-component system cell cycle response regulator DivK [Nitrospirae bacterium]|nr:MAG: two-component system cell cycle response regulator DivK [Nitrospirota bacterium]